MASFEQLKEKNPGVPLYKVTDAAFAPYGKVIEGYDTAQIVEACMKIPMAETGVAYVPTQESLEATGIAAEMNYELFGEMDAQIGLCWGRNTALNALEYHLSSEFNIAATPLVLLLAKEEQIVNGRLNSADVKGFYLEKGQMVEVYATSLHYAPCMVEESGFSCVVALHKGTNEELEGQHRDKMLFAVNKWLIAHEANRELLSQGAVGGIYGENITLKL